MDTIKVEASIRTEAGKASARRLRGQGRVPAIAYGKDLASVSLAISPKGLTDVLKSERGQNSVVELGIDGGKKITALLREYVVHPVTREVLHVDFLEIKLDQPVDVEVPFVCKGKAAGVVLGGILRQVYRRLPIRCLPEQIPTVIEHDVTALNLGDHVKASDLGLPPGVAVRLPKDQTVAGVVAPDKERPEDIEAAAAAAVPGAATPGGTTPPAAGGAAAAAAPAAGGKEAAGKDEKKGGGAGGKEKKK
jgi:large subunit ribosomal protein L25